MSETIETPPVDPATVVADDPQGTGGIEEQRIEFDAYLKTRYPNEAASGFPRPMILGATWPITSADVGINNTEVWDPDDGVVIIIPLYSGMTLNEQLKFCWGDRTATVTIQQVDINNKYASGRWPSSAITEGKLDVFYKVLRNGKWVESQKLSTLVRFGQPGHEGSGTPSELPKPIITKPASGKVGLNEAKADIEVTIPAYKRMSEFDTVWLHWGDEVIKYVVRKAEIGKSIVVKVPESVVLAAGDSDALPVYYFVSDEVDNESEWSADTHAKVEVAALTFVAPNVIDPREPGNTAQSIMDLDKSGGEGLQIKASGFQVHDTIAVKWRSTTESGMVELLDLGTVDIKSADEVVQFTVAQEKLRFLTGGSGHAYYEVTRNGVVTVSKSAHVSFVGSLSDSPPAPTIEGAESVEMGWWVDADLPFAFAVVPKSANLVDGDMVNVVMRGTAADSTTLLLIPRNHRVTESQAGKELKLRLKGASFLKPLDGGFVDMYYTIKRGSGKVESIRERFYIGYIQETLPAPTTEIDLSPSNNVLDPTRPDYAHGVYVEIPELANVPTPCTFTLVWETSAGGYHEQEQKIEVGDEVTAFLVPAEELKLDGKAIEVTVYYIVSQEDKPDRASADLIFTIATPDLLIAPFEVSSATMYLRGGVVEMMQMQNNAWRVVAPRVNGVHARTQQRIPMGGKPPFRYQSSNPAIAAVDGSGRVWPKRSGSVSVTITDSKNNVVSYPVQVSYCFKVLVGQGNYNLLDAEKLVRDYYGTYVSADVMQDLHTLYGYPLPLGRHTWTGQRLHWHGGGSGYFYHMTTKQLHSANTNNTNVLGAMMMQPI